MPSNKGYICRYWALGPRCPNVDAFGASTCEFAHWDSGRMATTVQQRGTCLPWKHYGFCGRGVGCWYEHRETGVTGLYQGTIELTGFELQVADAATKAGFNTFNHEALFELIWAVKRLALRKRPLHFLGHLPKDPIYPDRYRPSGVSDNTHRKRRAVTIQPPSNHTGELKFHPVQPLMRKRPLANSKEDNLIDLTFSSDSECDPTDSYNITSKRQKAVNGSIIPSVGDTRLRYANGLPGRNVSLASAGITSKPPSRGAHNRANRRARAAARAAVPVVLNLPPIAPPTAEEEISKQLLLVKSKLDDARKNMNTCQATMKALFDAHYEKFDNDKMMGALQKLSGFMNKVYDGGKEGAEEADKAIALLGDKKSGVL